MSKKIYKSFHEFVSVNHNLLNLYGANENLYAILKGLWDAREEEINLYKKTCEDVSFNNSTNNNLLSEKIKSFESQINNLTIELQQKTNLLEASENNLNQLKQELNLKQDLLIKHEENVNILNEKVKMQESKINDLSIELLQATNLLETSRLNLNDVKKELTIKQELLVKNDSLLARNKLDLQLLLIEQTKLESDLEKINHEKKSYKTAADSAKIELHNVRENVENLLIELNNNKKTLECMKEKEQCIIEKEEKLLFELKQSQMENEFYKSQVRTLQNQLIEDQNLATQTREDLNYWKEYAKKISNYSKEMKKLLTITKEELTNQQSTAINFKKVQENQTIRLRATIKQAIHYKKMCKTYALEIEKHKQERTSLEKLIKTQQSKLQNDKAIFQRMKLEHESQMKELINRHTSALQEKLLTNLHNSYSIINAQIKELTGNNLAEVALNNHSGKQTKRYEISQ